MAEGRRGDRDEVVYGLHPVLEALEGRARTVDRVLVARERGGAKLGRLLRVARDSGVPVSHVPRRVLARAAGAGKTHQGVVAVVSAVPYADPDRLCRSVEAREDGLLIALDGVQDPRNLGAVIRTAAAAGAHGILLPGAGAVGLTAAVAKTSAGGVERIEVAREPKLPRRLRDLASRGFSVVGLDARGEMAWSEATLTGRIIIVAGSEGRGLRKGVREVCNPRLAIPLAAGVESLNVAVSVGVVLFEAVRQRRAGTAGG
jgi:23S rRNA (guanosine2251-2'-O)-methyltransferase